ncbi:MAG: bifunctional riboflavin kinase/FAD synthetase [Desulfuromonadales bacterium]|nr:bifunctional riboflavin kinase/FAD synthetase [Desulfuromonadales bacterium]
MVIIDTTEELRRLEGPSVVTLGNFDGVHLGHRALFRRTVQRAREFRARSVVYTFEPHPLKILAPDRAPNLLNTPEEKERLIAASHLDMLIRTPFTRELASWSAGDFVREVLVGCLRVKYLVVGYDYAFGRGREGDSDFLRAQGEKYGFGVDVLQPIGVDGQPYSSTRIRDMIAAGAVRDVVALLGRNYTFEGRVIPGEQRGRDLGFPTANLLTDKEQLPAAGVYAVKVRHREQEYAGVVNIGDRPTFGDGEITIEVHLLDFTGNLYNEVLRLYFVERLRDEQCFASVEELQDAINRDVLRSRQLLESSRVIQYREYLGQLEKT